MMTLARQSSPTNTPERKYARQFRHGPYAPKGLTAVPTTVDFILQRKPHCACGGSCPRCQAQAAAQSKLTISAPDDQYEQEADRVAEAVMHMPDPGVAEGKGAIQQAHNVHIQQFCPKCGELRRQPMEGEKVGVELESPVEEETEEEGEEIVPDETGMPKRESGTGGLTPSLLIPIRIPREGGQPLEPRVLHFMEQRIGHDFSRVHVHTDAAAVKSARQLRAYAYTVGHDIYFNAGQYNPDSFEGRRLLAHELTHVVQQTGSGELKGFGVQMQRARRTRTRRQACPEPPPCANTCTRGSCPQGKQRRATRDDCSESEPVNRMNYITALHVSLSNRTVRVMWWAEGLGGYSEVWPCSPSPLPGSCGTPRHDADHPELVGKKCSINHTNRYKDGMAWFTGFRSEDLRIGFHNSQRVGPECRSHGCVRVCCDKAEIINRNTWSGRTLITVT